MASDLQDELQNVAEKRDPPDEEFNAIEDCVHHVLSPPSEVTMNRKAGFDE